MIHRIDILATFPVTFLMVACGTTVNPSGGAGEGGAGGDTSVAGGGGAGVVPPDDPSQCFAQPTEEQCLALRCYYRDAVLFAELVCGTDVPIKVCTWWAEDGLDGMGSSAYVDTEEGRIVTDLPDMAVPYGFEDECSHGGDHCEDCLTRP